MSIEEQLNADLKDQMRAKNADTVACIRQLKSKVQETVNAKGFSGPVDDALYQKVIASYVKSLEKGIGELQAAGERGAPLRAKYQAEIDYLGKYMPKLLGEAETLALVKKAIATAGATDPKQAGKVLGVLMKEHKGQIDAALAKSLVERELAGG
jgi:uncharacterized protein YqeY